MKAAVPSLESLIIGIVGLFCLLVLVLASVPLLVKDSKIKARLQKEGVVVEGIVLDRKRGYVPRATVRFTLTYQYSYGGGDL